ncbi:MAG: hypothetical protein QXS19_09880 [Candidatus Methanomethylicia archaeon]
MFKKNSLLFTFFILSLTFLVIIGMTDTLINGSYVSLSSSSSLFVVNVSVNNEKIMFADHSEDLAEGNWIILSGGT